LPVTIEIFINCTRVTGFVRLYPAGIALPSRWCFWFLVSGTLARSAICRY